MDRQQTLSPEQLIILLDIVLDTVSKSERSFNEFSEIAFLLLEDIAGVDDEQSKHEIVQILWSMNIKP